MEKSFLNRRYKRVIQLELNEISIEVVKNLISRGQLPHFAKINREWSYFETTSESEYVHIEPWIQWPTVHTGHFMNDHGLFRLSDSSAIKVSQIWEALSEQKIESAVISPMNAHRGHTVGGVFFPDPWAKSNDSYPESLSALFALISRRVQGHAVASPSLREVWQGLNSCWRFQFPLKLYVDIGSQLARQKWDHLSKWRLAVLFDQLLVSIFENLLSEQKYRFNSLFLNSVAHYQHHYWRNFEPELFDDSIKSPDCRPKHDPVTYGYKLYDKILSKILSYQDEDTLIMIASGLSQVPFVEKEKEGGFNYYRLKNHDRFVKFLGFDNARVFPLMSRDWQIVYNSAEEMQKIRTVLEGLFVADEALFQIDSNREGSLFIETTVTKKLKSKDVIVQKNGTELGRFDDWFQNIAIKSGHHVGKGCFWVSEAEARKNNMSPIPLTALFHIGLEALRSS